MALSNEQRAGATATLDAIAAILAGEAWTAATGEAIAAVLAQSGRRVRAPEERAPRDSARPRCSNCLNFHGPLDNCALGVLAGVVRDRWQAMKGKPEVSPELLGRVDAEAFWNRIASVADWLESELERVAYAKRFAFAVIVDANSAAEAKESTEELMANDACVDQRLVAVGEPCELGPGRKGYETVEIQLRAEGIPLAAYPTRSD